MQPNSRILFAFLLLLDFVAAHAATTKLVCHFKDKHGSLLYTVAGTLNSNQALQIEKIVNSTSAIARSTVTATEVNNNPVPQFKSSTGNLRYDIDAMSTDPEYGDKYVLYFMKLEKSANSFPVSLRYTNYSGSAGAPDYAEGTCTNK